MPNLINLPTFKDNGDVEVVIETPRGSRAKFAYDPQSQTFTLAKSLLVGLTYPYDWALCRRQKLTTAIRSTSWSFMTRRLSQVWC
jgi:hypothetical protein